MVTHSPYKKALNMTGLMTVMGVVFFLIGLSQLATLPRPNWILVILGAVTAIIGALLFIWVDKNGKKYLSTTGYEGGKPFADVSMSQDFR